MGKQVSKLPASESGPNARHTTASGRVYCVSRNPKRGVFTLWSVTEAGYEKLAAKKSPYELYPMME